MPLATLQEVWSSWTRSIRHCLQEMPWAQEAGHGYGFQALIIHLSIEILLLNYPEALSTTMATDSFLGTGNRQFTEGILLDVHQ